MKYAIAHLNERLRFLKRIERNNREKLIKTPKGFLNKIDEFEEAILILKNMNMCCDCKHPDITEDNESICATCLKKVQ